MKAKSLFALSILPMMVLSGCVINSTRPLPTGAPPAVDRAVVVFGVAVQGRWDHPGFAVELAEYSMRDQAMTGNCHRFNRITASIPATPTKVRYFAFEAPPGSYVYSPFMTAPLDVTAAPGFAAPPGRTSYVGDFVLGQDGRVALHRDLPGVEPAIRQALPGLSEAISLAEAATVLPPRPFMCTP